MDRDQERFYEDEQSVNQPNTNGGDNEIVDDMSFFMRTFKALRDILSTGFKVPLGNGKAVVDARLCLEMLDDMEKNLPEAIQYGWQMYSERERIMGTAENEAMTRVATAELSATKTLDNARAEANRLIKDADDEAKNIVEDAKIRADKLVSENAIVEEAREEAQRIKNDAKVEMSEARLKFNHETIQMLTNVEDNLTQSLQSIRNSLDKLDPDRQ